ncbi:hypothetical protein H105_04219 [Trichophyton soudanense CBS 452.61]|uniref:Uncharacterized protein n=1 Tax=Trichophyton soudanense CBS 452.61 TaxID=1215331 RepID=A0A022XT17_TRISD|nr:hypothetical protein H105_04219 [Trichophyton soudanense CBS 452.61]
MNRVGWYTYPYNPYILVGTYPAFVPHRGGSKYMWDAVSGRIIEILDRVGTQWVAVECFERRQVHNYKTRGEYAEICETTVLITVQEFPYIDSDYKKILHEFYECSGGLFIELLEGTVWCGATETAYGWSINEHDLRFQYAIDDGDEKLWSPYGGCYLLLSKPGQELPRMSRSAVWHAIMLSAYIRCPTTQEFAINKFGKPSDDLEYESEEEEHIGNVLARSGLAVSEEDNCRLDWAVALCQPGKCGKNVSMSNVRRNTTTVTIDRWARPTILLEEERRAVLTRNAGQETRTNEWAAVSGREGHFVVNDPCGQLVGESNDEALGVVWGGTRSRLTTDVAVIYITPLHTIAQGIREATGYDVSLAGGSKIV